MTKPNKTTSDQPKDMVEAAKMYPGTVLQGPDGYSYFKPKVTREGPKHYPCTGIEYGNKVTNFGPRSELPHIWSSSLIYRWPSTPSLGHNGGPPIETWEDSDGSLTSDTQGRTELPMADGLLDYFPNALAEVSRLSHVATQQHHPDEPMHWARGKSTDHRNKIMRHLVDTGKRDDKGMRHSAMVAWRALALLQEELEQDEGVPVSRASRLPEEG